MLAIKFRRVGKLATVCLTVGAMFRAEVALGQCEIEPGNGIPASDWDQIFTQDGPGKGLEPKGSPGWTGGDSTYSLILPNGDTAFFFSDSYIAESPRAKGDGTVRRTPNGLRTTALNCFPPTCQPAASVFGARNSIAILSKDRKVLKSLVGTKNAAGLSTSYFKDPAKDLNYWVGEAILLSPRSILVFLHKFDPKLSFHGAAVAQLNTETLSIEKLQELRNAPDRKIHWGTSAMIENGFLYIYGKGISNGKKRAFVARTKTDSIENISDASTWLVWNGSAWVKGLENAHGIIPAQDSVSDEFNIVRITINGKTRYIFAGIDTTVPFGFWRDITLYSSCAPEGPFTGKHVVYSMPESRSDTVPGLPASKKLSGNLVVYNPHIHAQFTQNGRLLISYNINRSNNSDSIYIDGYRPRFIYVPVAGLK